MLSMCSQSPANEYSIKRHSWNEIFDKSQIQKKIFYNKSII